MTQLIWSFDLIVIVVEAINSPRVSTVLPQKRARSRPDLQSPRQTRQQTFVRSQVEQVDMIESSRQRVRHNFC